VTGLGIVSPVGLNIKDSWDNILAGKSGITPITHFDASAFATQFSGSVKDFDVTEYMSAKDARKMDVFIHYGIAAGTQALKDSGLEVTAENAHRIGVSIGSGIGGLSSIEKGHDAYLKGGPRKISPFFVPSSIINMISGNFSIMHGLKGPNIAIVTACTTGTHSVGDAGRMIAHGDADVMVAGGAEMATSPMGLGGFCSARALSTRNDSPETASRPWDKDRDGFVLGDGAGVMVLEEYEHAKARGANIYAELIGFGMSGDAYHMTSPSEGGEGAMRCMQNAMSTVDAPIDYINAHGTSTPAGDMKELEAVKNVFGDKVPPISSTKSLTGHALGAAGVNEAIYSLLMQQEGFISASANITELDEAAAGSPIVMERIDNAKLDTVMSNSFGFGGTNATLIFGRYKD